MDRVLFMSGYAAEEMVEGAEILTDSHYLEKPFSMDGLLAAVSRALDGEPDGDEEPGTGVT